MVTPSAVLTVPPFPFVPLCQDIAAADNVYVRVVSMPCCELFDAKDLAYQMEIFPEGEEGDFSLTIPLSCAFLPRPLPLPLPLQIVTPSFASALASTLHCIIRLRPPTPPRGAHFLPIRHTSLPLGPLERQSKRGHRRVVCILLLAPPGPTAPQSTLSHPHFPYTSSPPLILPPPMLPSL